MEIGTKSSGTFTPGTGTVFLTGSGGTITSDGSAFNDVTLNDGLVGYWKLDEGSDNTCSGGEDACDSSGYGNHGTIQSGDSDEWTTTTADLNFTNPYAMDFDGSDDYVDAGDIEELFNISAMTASFWARPDVIDDVSRYIMHHDNSPTFKVYSHTNGNLYLEIGNASDGGIATIDQSTIMSVGTWVHIAWVFDGTKLSDSDKVKLFADGTQKTLSFGNSFDNTTTGDYSAESFRIGGDDDEPFDLNGRLDDVRIYNRALSAGEITALAAGNLPATSSVTWTLGDALDVNGDLKLMEGVLDVSGSNYGVNLGGDIENFAGMTSFTARSGTVTLDGTDQSFTGTGMTFSALTKVEGVDDGSDETLTFAAGATYNISGTWTLTGRDSEDRINLVSGSGGSAWYVNPSGSRSLSVVDVKDSYNLHATAVNVTSGVDSTGNTNWTFDAGGGEAPEFTWWALLMLMLVCGWVLQRNRERLELG